MCTDKSSPGRSVTAPCRTLFSAQRSESAHASSRLFFAARAKASAEEARRDMIYIGITVLGTLTIISIIMVRFPTSDSL